MRRRLEIYIPIVLIALWVQILAPLAAFGVIVQAASNPLLMSEICHGAASQDDVKTVPANSRDDSATCCTVCSIGHGGALALDPPMAVFVRLQLDYQKLSWLDATDPVRVIKARSTAQARAPPLSS